MNVYYFIAGLFAISLTASHVLAGEVLFFKGIQGYPQTRFGDGNVTMRLMKGAWHMLTLVMVVSATGLFLLAFTNILPEPKLLGQLISFAWGGCTIPYLAYALPRPFMLLRSPIWINTVGTCLFAWLGSR